MKSTELDIVDAGRLEINRAFRGLLESHGLVTFDALMQPALGTPVKATLSHRHTARIELDGADPPRALYIKRHEPAPLREYIKPLMHGRLPLIGARAEWEALLRFHALGIPTMTPVAFGRDGRRSFVLTDALAGCTKLSEWTKCHLESHSPQARRDSARLARALGRLARAMHRGGLHHQDFYLNHILLNDGGPDAHAPGGFEGLHIIDLGRVHRLRFPALRWIIKDLAQLEFSAHLVPRTDRMRFLNAYLGRPRRRRDRLVLWLIRRKAMAIARRQRRKAARSGGS